MKQKDNNRSDPQSTQTGWVALNAVLVFGILLLLVAVVGWDGLLLGAVL